LLKGGIKLKLKSFAMVTQYDLTLTLKL